MDDTKSSKTAQATSKAATNFIARELNGATFLTLEHTAHMILVVLVPCVLLVAAWSLFTLWSGPNLTIVEDRFALVALGMMVPQMHAMNGLWLVAALLVLTPWLVLLDRRTRAEWAKRKGYSTRLAYKLPLYGALGVTAAIIVALKICLIGVILKSLAVLGLAGTGISTMYMYEFLPALIALFTFYGVIWYLFKLAKGVDLGKAFSKSIAAASILVLVSLFVASVMYLRSSANSQSMPMQDPLNKYMDPGYNSSPQTLEDYFK